MHELPGIVAAAESTRLLTLTYDGVTGEIDIPSQTHTERWDAVYELCSEGYFPRLGLRLMRGRTLSNFDVNDARKVAVVNQTFVNRYVGSRDPIERHVKLMSP